MLSKNDACLLGVLELWDTWLILWLFVEMASNDLASEIVAPTSSTDIVYSCYCVRGKQTSLTQPPSKSLGAFQRTKTHCHTGWVGHVPPHTSKMKKVHASIVLTQR